ncbi:hypothetical protein FRC11_008424 [Ceratobasidium sp. 423]|nr:hypothetical protein FRC11_008424 [Ceratobasidium sp. 423]
MSSKLLMNFVDMFISPSLTDIRIKFHEKGCSTYTHPSSTLGFLKKVQNTCPEIQALEFYPGIRFVYNSAEPSPFDEQCRDVLQTFSNLCSFSSTTRILDSKTFGVLGNLPRLESLGVRGSRMDLPVLDERLSIPAHWFKKLIDLQLYDVHPQDIKLLWGQPSMVTKLGSVLIQTDPTTAPKPLVESKDGNRWIESFLLGLSTLSPHLYDFTFYVGDEDGTMFQISEGAQNSLRNLKLKNTKIRLRNTYGVDENSEDEGYDYGDYPLA